MTAVQKKNLRMPKVVRIESADYVPPYKLRLLFDDGHESLVDFEPFLSQSRHPAVQAYHDRKRFRNFALEDGFLHWNDFDLVFPMADLYAGDISFLRTRAGKINIAMS